MNKTTQIKRTGNGAYIPVTREELKALRAEIATEVTVTIADGRMTVVRADSSFERTRRSAEKMGARYARTLDLFGQ